MRLRNVKNKQEIMDNAINLILNPKDYKGKWKEVFNNNNPIYIEIGMGKGDFIIEHAKRYPDINFIGIERFDSVIVRAIEKVPEEIPNLRFTIKCNSIIISIHSCRNRTTKGNEVVQVIVLTAGYRIDQHHR